MTTVSSTNSTTAGSAAASAAAATDMSGGTVEGAEDRFLQLLVTQLKNQDPLNPLDNAQITTQLAQLSTVTGINKLNTTIEAMSASADARQFLQATSLVDHDVVVPGNTFALAEGAGHGAFDLKADADQVTVTVTDT